MTERTIVLPPASTPNGQEANYRLTLMVPKRRFLSYLRERWWVVLASLVLTIGAVGVYETVRTEKFTSYARLYLSGEIQLSSTAMFTEDSQTYFGTQIELLKSARLYQAALEQLGTAATDKLKDPFAIEVNRPMATSILQLRATGSDPALTQQYLQALVREYLAYKKETRKSTSADLVVALTEQLARREKDLKAEQDKWTEFQKTNNAAVLEEEAKSAGIYLAELNLQRAKLKLEQNLLSQSLAAVAPSNLESNRPTAVVNLATPAQPEATNSVATSDDLTLRSARLELAVLLGDKETKARTMGERKFDQEVARLQRLVSILEEDARAKKTAELQELDRRILAIEAAIPAWQSKVLDINERLAQAQRLKGNIQREQASYNNLQTTLQNADFNQNVQQERLSVLEPPSPGRPEQRNFAFRIALAIVGGLALSLGIVFAWHLLDDRFVSARDIKDQFGETLLGLVPQIKTARGKPGAALLEANDARAAYLESFRHLRSALLLGAPGENRPQTLLLSSAGPAEGKTTIAANLARLLARSGRRVVLVDADVVRGGLQQLFGGADQPGVSDYLRGQAEAQQIVQATELAGLSFVSSGTRGEHSEELWQHAKLADLLAELRADRDFVILDSAPILSSDAAAQLVPLADNVILVSRPFYTRSRLLRRAMDLLYQRQARQVTIVLNRARADDLAGHYVLEGLSPAARNGKS